MPAPHLERILITGATGTLGCNLVRHLSARHPETRLYVLMRTLDPALFAGLPNVHLQQLDLADRQGVDRIVADTRPNAVLHCAASGVRPNTLDYFDVVDINVSATMQLFRASCLVQDCHFLHVSTGLVYESQGRPHTEDDPVNTLHPYGAGKAAADGLLRAGAARLGRRLTIVRPFSFTGLHDGGDRLFPSLLRAALERRPFPMSPGSQLRDFCAVQDVVEAITLLLEEQAGPGSQLFNIGSGLSISLADIVHSVRAQLALDVDVQLGARAYHPLEPHSLIAGIQRMCARGWAPRINLAYAVWQLARADFPALPVQQPELSL